MSDRIKTPRIMIAGTNSGSGKTTVTCGLLRLLQKKGIEAAAFKCGPDYIDPMFHRRILGVPSRNLDIFFSGRDGLSDILLRGSRGRALSVIEGVMGLYDGMSFSSAEGSSIEVAGATDTPVILCVSCRGMGRSIIPMIKGYLDYDEKDLIKAVFLNNISPMAAKEIAPVVKNELRVPVIGWLQTSGDLDIGSRHLGLMMPGEIRDLEEKLDKLSEMIEENLDLDLFLEIAGSAEDVCSLEAAPEDVISFAAKREHKVRVGVARDEAFCFYYEENLELLEKMGAEIVFFSPIHDRSVPEVDRLIFGGGYPELYAKELSENINMKESIKAAADTGMPILAECGGFLYLLSELSDPEGNSHEMVGVLSGSSHKTGKLGHFGYVTLSPAADNPYLSESESIRGHEFHYYDATDNGDACTVTKPNGRSWQGYRAEGKVFAGFAHLYYRSCPEFIERFLSGN